MKKIKTVFIGTGHDHAMFNFKAAMESELFDIVGFVVNDENYRNADLFNQNEFGVKRISLDEAFAIDDLEAAIVETHDSYLVKYAQLALDRGLHVFMDKPGSQNCEDFEKMLSTAKEKKRVFSMGYMYRYNPEIIRAKKLVEDGSLGTIFSVEAHMSCFHGEEKRRWLGEFKGGMTFFLGCHLVDLIFSIMGIPEEIIPLNASTGILDVDSEDFGMAVFKYKNGSAFLKATACESGGFMRRQLVISGSKGTIEIHPIEEKVGGEFGSEYVVTRSRECINANENIGGGWDWDGVRRVTNKFDRYKGMLIDFAHRIESKAYSTEAELLYEARLHRMLLAACGIECDYKTQIDI
jgi:predicted dehydrogenase